MKLESWGLEDSTNGVDGFLEDSWGLLVTGAGADSGDDDDELSVAKGHSNRGLTFIGRGIGVDIESGETEIEEKRAIV